MKKYALLLLIGIGVVGRNPTLAANPTTWTQGELILNDGTQLTGELNYNWKAEIVQLRQQNTLKAYSAFQVKLFRYFDNQQNLLRSFTSVEFPVKTTLLRPVFLEEVVTGPLVVYRRLRHSLDPFRVGNAADFASDGEFSKNIDMFTYFVFDGSSFADLDRFNQSIWPRLEQEFHTELHQYMHSHAVARNDTMGRLLLINQYNALKSQATPYSTDSEVAAASADQ